MNNNGIITFDTERLSVSPWKWKKNTNKKNEDDDASSSSSSSILFLSELDALLASSSEVTAFLPENLQYKGGTTKPEDWAETFAGDSDSGEGENNLIAEIRYDGKDNHHKELAGLLLLRPDMAPEGYGSGSAGASCDSGSSCANTSTRTNASSCAIPMHVGYIFGKAHWGKGLATELLKGLVSNIVLHHKNKSRQSNYVSVLHAGVARGNPASERVLQKAGFHKAVAKSSGTTTSCADMKKDDDDDDNDNDVDWFSLEFSVAGT